MQSKYESTMNKEDVLQVVEYLKKIDEIEVISYDELLKGKKGFVAFHCDKEKLAFEGKPACDGSPLEHSLSLSYCFAKPVEPEDTIRLSMDYTECPNMGDAEKVAKALEPAIEQIEECLTEDGWLRCDIPKTLRVGFVKLADIDSDEKSIHVSMRLTFYNVLPQELRDRVEAFREQSLSTEEKDLKTQIEETELR